MKGIVPNEHKPLCLSYPILIPNRGFFGANIITYEKTKITCICYLAIMQC